MGGQVTPSSRKRVFIVGAGGLGREARQYAADTLDHGLFEVIGFLDDAYLTPERGHNGLAAPVLGAIQSHVPEPDDRYLMAIGDPVVRAKAARDLMSKGATFLTIIHPLAYVASSASIGDGCIVAPFATIGAGARLEPFTHAHFYASSAHDSVVGPFASLSPYAVVNGQAIVGECGFLGTHAIVNPTKRVGAFAKVTAGSVVYRDVPDNSIADGNPAKSRPQLGFTSSNRADSTADNEEQRSSIASR